MTEIEVTQQTAFAKRVLEEVFDLIEDEGKKLGPGFSEQVMLTILASFICTLIYRKLKNNPSSDVQVVTNAYFAYKVALENAISSGFTAAFQEFSGQDIDYFTQVLPVPEPINKILC